MVVDPSKMGKLTCTREFESVHFKSSSPSFDQYFAHISKKSKLSFPMNQKNPQFDQHLSSNSVVSKVHQYPDSKTSFQREIHAPVRNSRFGFSSSTNKIDQSTSEMGNMLGILGLQYEKAKLSAFKTIRHFGRKKELVVVEIDDDDDDIKEMKNNVSEVSSLEVIEINDDDKEKKICLSEDFASKEIENLEQNSMSKGKTVEKEFLSWDSCADMSGGGKKTENLMDLIVLDLEPDIPTHRKFYASAERRSDKLKSLTAEIEIAEKQFQKLQLLRPQVINKEDVSKECFLPLTVEEEAEVNRNFSDSYSGMIVASHEPSSINITGELLQCLRPGGWLNDEVINLYLELLKEREKREPGKFLKCHFFSTFFYEKLIGGKGGYNYESAAKWTSHKKLGYSLLECDKIFMPIHKPRHWCLAIINSKDKKFQYLDSLGGTDNQIMNEITRYYIDEVKNKNGKDVDVSSWKQEFVEDLPRQKNGFDCGMFMIKYIDFYSRDIGLCFKQEHMPYFRRRTAKEILRLRAD